jgi:hypothetical protein
MERIYFPLHTPYQPQLLRRLTVGRLEATNFSQIKDLKRNWFYIQKNFIQFRVFDSYITTTVGIVTRTDVNNSKESRWIIILCVRKRKILAKLCNSGPIRCEPDGTAIRLRFRLLEPESLRFRLEVPTFGTWIGPLRGLFASQTFLLYHSSH